MVARADEPTVGSGDARLGSIVIRYEKNALRKGAERGITVLRIANDFTAIVDVAELKVGESPSGFLRDDFVDLMQHAT